MPKVFLRCNSKPTGSIRQLLKERIVKANPRRKLTAEESFYPKRTLADGELDISKTIQENFNLLRVGNNDAWPSFFYYKGVKYILKIFKDE